MNTRTVTDARLSNFVWILLGFNILVILWGAWVRISGSGDGCGSHWPTCHGTFIPPSPSVKTLTELSHRLTSAIAGLSSIALVVWSQKAFPKKHPVRLGAFLTLILIVVEGLLGAGLVLFRYIGTDDSVGRALYLPLHLANTFTLLGSLLYTGLSARGIQITFRNQGTYIYGVVIALIAGLLTGMSGAIAALGDTLFPKLSTIKGLESVFSGQAHYLIELRLLHPILALITIGILLWFVQATQKKRPSAEAQFWGDWTTRLIWVQLAIGILNVISKAAWYMQILHLGFATLMWLAVLGLAASGLHPRFASKNVALRFANP